MRQKWTRNERTNLKKKRIGVMTTNDKSLTTRMSSGERVELSKVVRIRSRLAKKEVDVLVSRLLANVEQQLAARFSEDHERFATVTAEAHKVIEKADAEIAKRSKEMGIPEQFRPSLDLIWNGRGENAFKERRRELRALAEKELNARGQDAKLAIDRSEAALLTEIMAEGLTSEAAKNFLERMPTPEQLMPRLLVSDLEKRVPLRLVAGPYYDYRDERSDER
jgi:hypothetical protein